MTPVQPLRFGSPAHGDGVAQVGVCEAANDSVMMQRCIALARSSGRHGESPYAAVIASPAGFICESLNRARRDRDATRHAELVAISEAQRARGTVNLDQCTLYSLVEPCPMCAYAARETRVARVVYALQSPVMGAHHHWNVLADEQLSDRMPEVFAPPPAIVAGYMQQEAAAAMRDWNPLFWSFMQERGLITTGAQTFETAAPFGTRCWHALLAMFRTHVVDRLWRS